MCCLEEHQGVTDFSPLITFLHYTLDLHPLLVCSIKKTQRWTVPCKSLLLAFPLLIEPLRSVHGCSTILARGGTCSCRNLVTHMKGAIYFMTLNITWRQNDPKDNRRINLVFPYGTHKGLVCGHNRELTRFAVCISCQRLCMWGDVYARATKCEHQFFMTLL